MHLLSKRISFAAPLLAAYLIITVAGISFAVMIKEVVHGLTAGGEEEEHHEQQ
jgi:hypothetical protein